jgi:beta-glucanase (GH16 family)
VLTFSDEFDNGFNTSKWNDHLWYQSSDPVINYRVSNGSLKIWPASNFVDRTIDTDGKFSQTYGYFEAEMKLPIGKGVWPAFWLYAHPGDARPEIDIMEAYPGGGSGSGWGDGNLHPVNYGLTLHKANADYSYHEVPYATKLRDFSSYGSGVDLSAAFHTYGVKWEPSGVTFYFDGKQLGPKYQDTAGYYNRPMYILLDLWFGSASGSPDGSTPLGEGNSFEVRYVRAWQFK